MKFCASVRAELHAHVGTRRELRRSPRCGAAREVERSTFPRRQRDDPRRTNRLVKRDGQAVDDEAFGKNFDEFKIAADVPALPLVGQRRHPFLLVARMPRGGGVDVFGALVGEAMRLGAARSDGSESPLPDAALVGERAMRMPADGHGVRERRKGATRLPFVVAVGIRAVACSGRMGVLDVEKRLVRVERRCHLGDELLDGRLDGPPLRAKEGKALDLAPPDRRPLLSQKTAPRLFGVVSVEKALRREFFLGEAVPAASPCVDVVVAGDKQQLDSSAIRSATAGEHSVPDPREHLHF